MHHIDVCQLHRRCTDTEIFKPPDRLRLFFYTRLSSCTHWVSCAACGLQTPGTTCDSGSELEAECCGCVAAATTSQPACRRSDTLCPTGHVPAYTHFVLFDSQRAGTLPSQLHQTRHDNVNGHSQGCAYVLLEAAAAAWCRTSLMLSADAVRLLLADRQCGQCRHTLSKGLARRRTCCCGCTPPSCDAPCCSGLYVKTLLLPPTHSVPSICWIPHPSLLLCVAQVTRCSRWAVGACLRATLR